AEETASLEAVSALRLAEGERAAALRADLRRRMGTTLFGQWIEPVAFSLESGALVVTTHTAFVQKWVEDHHLPTISAAAQAVLQRAVPVTFRVAERPG